MIVLFKDDCKTVQLFVFWIKISLSLWYKKVNEKQPKQNNHIIWFINQIANMKYVYQFIPIVRRINT